MVYRKNGFTLIELLIVVALIMILSAVGVGSYTQATVKSKDTQRKSDLNQISKALESFNADVARYPLSLPGESYPHCYVKSGSVTTNPTCTSNKLIIRIDGSIAEYISLPEDPDPSQDYVYVSTDGKTYALYAALENTSDKDLLKDDNGNVVSDPWGISCGSVQCNYRITEVGLTKENE